jgi:hypothetical protein
VTLDPSQAQWLAKADPESLASHSPIVDSAEVRSLIVESLLRRADEVELGSLPWARRPWNLGHSGLADQLLGVFEEAGGSEPEDWPSLAGTGKSHALIVLGVAAVEAGHRVRHFTAAELVETLYRGLADNSVGRVIDTLLRADLVIVDELGFAPLDDTGAQLLFRFVAAAYERRALGIGSHWPFDQWGRFLPEHTTAVSLLDRLLHHSIVVVTEGESFRMREARARGCGPIKKT